MAASRCFIFMYFLLPHWEPATYRRSRKIARPTVQSYRTIHICELALAENFLIVNTRAFVVCRRAFFFDLRRRICVPWQESRFLAQVSPHRRYKRPEPPGSTDFFKSTDPLKSKFSEQRPPKFF